ncbi:MAG: TrkH family potassium uptake protein [Clostridiales bacterium]|nr:TrkH family potassium uptake protein [Clostridiales bacterium]
MNYRIILHTLGWVLNLEALAFLLPLVCAAVYGEPYIPLFAVCIGVCAFFGILLTLRVPKKKTMYSKEGFITVALAWIVMSIMGALPFVLSGFIPSFVDALFETVSGFTTTGASILSDVEVLPKCLLFWRSFTHWIGGMGVLVFLVAILPLAGGDNLFLIKAESPGPSVSKLVPKVKTTATLLYRMYFALTLLEILLLYAGGLDMFSSLTISFGTAGTGGFSIKNSGLADYSPYVQNVVTIFMIIFGVDFSLYYMLILRKFKDVAKSDELRVYLGIILLAITFISFNCRGLFESAATAIRYTAFQVASIMTTTGFATADYDKWPELSKTMLVTLMFIGACAGSTAGGIKVSRIVILVKSIFKEVKLVSHPKSTHKVMMNGRVVEHDVIRAVNVYMAAYMLIFAVSLMLICIDGKDFTTNFTAVASTMNNVGPGLAGVGPTRNFGEFSTLSKLVLSADMLIGRLEIFPILVLISPYAWRK